MTLRFFCERGHKTHHCPPMLCSSLLLPSSSTVSPPIAICPTSSNDGRLSPLQIHLAPLLGAWKYCPVCSLSCMQGRYIGVFFLNNFALAEQLQNSERLNFVRKKKRRRPRKARRWLHEGKVPCALNQIFFLVHEYLDSERPVLFELSAPTRLTLQGSHVRRKFRKRTTLRSKSSTLIGLLYAGWRSCCKVFVARKAALSPWSEAWARKLSKTSNNQTIQLLNEWRNWCIHS